MPEGRESSVAILIGADASAALREFERVKAAARVASGEIAGIGAAGAGGAAGVDVLAASGVRLDKSLRQSGAAVRALSVPLLSELGPAMGSTASRVAGVLGAAASLGGGMGALAVAAGGLAGILVGKLIGGLSESERGAKGLGHEIRTDATAFKELADKIDEAVPRLTRLQELTSKIDPRIARQLEGPLSPGRRLSAQQVEVDALFAELDTLLRARQEAKVDVEGTFGGGPAFEKLAQDLRALNDAKARAVTEAGVREQELAAAAVNRERQRVVAGLQAARELLESEKSLEDSRRQLLGETAAATRDFYAERLSLARVQADELARLAEEEAAAQLRSFDVQIADKRRQLAELRDRPGFAGDFGLQRQAVDLAADAKRLEDQKAEAARRGADEIRKINEDLARDLRSLEQRRTQEAIAEMQNRANAVRSAFSDLVSHMQRPQTPPPADMGIPGRGPETVPTAFDRVTAPATDPLRRRILLQMGLEAAREGDTDPSAFRLIRQGEELASGKVSLEGARALADERLRMAEEAARDLRMGRGITPEQWREVEALPRLREQVGAFRDPEAVRLMTGLQPTVQGPAGPQPETPIFQGRGPGGERMFTTEPRPGFDPVRFAESVMPGLKTVTDSFTREGAEAMAQAGKSHGEKYWEAFADNPEAVRKAAESISQDLGEALLRRVEEEGF